MLQQQRHATKTRVYTECRDLVRLPGSSVLLADACARAATVANLFLGNSATGHVRVSPVVWLCYIVV